MQVEIEWRVVWAVGSGGRVVKVRPELREGVSVMWSLMVVSAGWVEMVLVVGCEIFWFQIAGGKGE